MLAIRPDKLVNLLVALLQERKVVIIKSDVSDLALIMQALITLLQPFTWHHTLITYITEEMVDLLEAPVPFFIGVSSSVWDKIASIREYSSEIVIFDIET